MARYSFTVPPRVLAGLRRHAAATAPAECCGALIGVIRGRTAEIRTLIPVPNAAPDLARYLIEAATVRRLERQAACAGLTVIGFYHSHSVTAAEPSPADLEQACPGYLYVIVQGDSGAVRGWRLRDDRSGFAELDLAPLAGAA